MNAFIELLEYNVWANRRILNQAQDLAQEPALATSKDCFHFICNAIFHLIKADWSYKICFFYSFCVCQNKGVSS